MNKISITDKQPLINNKDVLGKDNSKDIKTSYDLIVFSHLRWEFVYQRPQHIISRLSKTYNILFVEEPIPFEEGQENSFDLHEINTQLHVLKPKVNSIEDISKILKTILKTSEINIGWFYSPAFSMVLTDFNFGTVIYDCMDELSLFKGAPKELIDQEKFLMAEVDLVFTGGKSLYTSKKEKAKHVYCFPSSVDQDHFEQASFDIPIPDDIKKIPKPIVGYFGVIDERLDLELIRQTALKLPKVSFVMIGPLAKIGEEDLPRLDNIHFLGMKSYKTLPNYLRAFDIAMMPFALNDATKYISPTKTLEYMAAGKSIISTAIKDVVRDYESCTYIIENEEDFIDTIQQILTDKTDDREKQYDVILAQTSWDGTVKKMQQLIKEIEK